MNDNILLRNATFMTFYSLEKLRPTRDTCEFEGVLAWYEAFIVGKYWNFMSVNAFK